MQAAAPPPPVPPAAVLRAQSANDLALAQDRRLLLTRAKQTEQALIRYQAVLHTELQAQDATPPGAAEAPAVRCVWKIESYLQRQICFWSLTGLFACAEPTSNKLAQADQSETVSAGPLTDGASACDLGASAVTGARARLSAAVASSAPALIEADLKQAVQPLLAKSGASVALRP